jgi:hypothetical protein
MIRMKSYTQLLDMVCATVVSVTKRLPKCGVKLFRVILSLQTILKEPFPSRWIFDVEI